MILETIVRTRDGAPKLHAMQLARDKAADVEVKAMVKLRKTLPTTIAGVMSVTAYIVEHMDAIPTAVDRP